MEKAPFALKAENITKSYSFVNKGTTDVINALDDISFTLEKGTITGIVGHNGCGKTTLLKIIAGLIKPSSGKLIVNGKVSAILEPGSGFHPDLSGIENIYLSGKLSGWKQNQIKKLIPEIIEFSEIDEYSNMPVKYYSQGMYLRLAFSMLIHLKSDIMVIDEVLSVGDQSFKAKCIQKVKSLAKEGITMVIVSHVFSEINLLCSQCIVISKGRIEAFGKPEHVYNNFLESLSKNKTATSIITGDFKMSKFFNITNNGFMEVLDFYTHPKGKNKGENIYFSDDIWFVFKWKKLVQEFSMAFHLHIFDEKDNLVICTSNVFDKKPETINEFQYRKKGEMTETCIIPGKLLNTGVYKVFITITQYLNNTKYELIGKSTSPLTFIINDDSHLPYSTFWTYTPAPVRSAFSWVHETKE